MRTLLAACLALLASAPLSLAHIPPTPELECNAAAVRHEYLVTDDVGFAVRGVSRGIGAGITVIYDGSALPCGFVPLCEGDLLDPDGEPGTGDEVPCGPFASVFAPVGDSEYEFSVGGAWLPGSHHGNVVCVSDLSGPVRFYVNDEGPFFGGCATVTPADGYWVSIEAGVWEIAPGLFQVSAPVGGHVSS